MITRPTNVPTHTDSQPLTTPRPGAQPHPVWCDPTRCTADPTSQAHGYRGGVGAEHRSVPVPLDLTTALWLPVRDGTAWLSQACTPWECAVVLHLQVGDLELSLHTDYAAPVLDVLSALIASAATAQEVTR